MEVEELKELLKGREKRTLEYKRAWNEVPKNMFDTVCSFLNRDGIVISNANKPFKSGPVTLKNYVRHPKNPHMANFFMQMGYAEHLGTGIRNLYHYVPLYTGADPKITDDDVYTVKMGLPKSMQMLKVPGEDAQMGLPDDVLQKLKERGIKLSKNQTVVLMAMIEDPSITYKEIHTRYGVVLNTVITCVRTLQDRGVVDKKTFKKDSPWKLKI